MTQLHPSWWNPLCFFGDLLDYVPTGAFATYAEAYGTDTVAGSAE